MVKFFNNRSESGHIATNEQGYIELDGERLVSERTFIIRSYIFHEDKFEELLRRAGFKTQNVWGGCNYEHRNEKSRFLVYCLTKR